MWEEKVRVREDALPEHTQYRDEGCEISPSCLRCPLPRCRYDEPGGIRSLLAEYRDREILRLRAEGWSVDDLARRFHVSRRSVFRILKRGSGGHLTPPAGPDPLAFFMELAALRVERRTRRSA